VATASTPIRSWLCPRPGDRDRLLDLDRRLAPYRGATFALLAAALVVEGPRIGWWTLAPLAVVALLFLLVSPRLEGLRRPEYAVAAAWAFTQLAMAGSAMLAGDAGDMVLIWMLLPVVTLPARFGMRGVGVGVVFTAVLIVVVALGMGEQHGTTELLVFPLVALVGMTLLSSALLRSDLEHRSQALVDPLTGLLNRNALTARTAELAQLSAVGREPIALVVADLDRFKAINDGHGHTTGDAVLRAVADTLRRSLRAYDLVYRFGGEEFVVVLPGADEHRAARLAEELRRAVAAEPMAGLHVTVSLGVAASPPGAFDFHAVFRDADVALYRAKSHGRDRVERAATP
jgi:diguanylate cyclase (GGDEF)-like protein